MSQSQKDTCSFNNEKFQDCVGGSQSFMRYLTQHTLISHTHTKLHTFVCVYKMFETLKTRYLQSIDTKQSLSVHHHTYEHL